MGRVRGRPRRWVRAGLGPRWIVAVSGGSDSVGLLRVLHAWAPDVGLKLSVAHLDHGARGEAGRQDAEFVEGLAQALGLPFDLGHWSPTRSAHFEADARRARYDWLVEVARRRGAAAVAVGHTRDDQAETILHRILRGTGPRGLAGIPWRRSLADGVSLVRPLLDVTRAELRAYLAALGQPFRDDATNEDRSRTRARIRHDLLPRLAAEYNPKVAEALARLGALTASAERGRRRASLARLRVVLLEADAGRIVLRREALARWRVDERAEVIRLAWRRVGWPEGGMGAEHWSRIGSLARAKAGRLSVAGGVDVAVEGDLLVLRRPAAELLSVMGPPAESLPLCLPGEVAWSGRRVIATLDSAVRCDETVDLDALVPPLFVRAAAPGDRFDPLGMGGKTTPLNDFLRGRGVRRDRRAEVPLVCDQKGIVWVAGHRIAERVRVTPETVRTVGLRWAESAFDAPHSMEDRDAAEQM